ncbi:MAG: hypothetical protein ABSH20_03250 [Tepidisphaeraceae bacterium]
MPTDALSSFSVNATGTAIVRLDGNTLRILNKCWKERGGKVQRILSRPPC